MTDKNTRGRASKVDLLPPNIKTQLAMMLRDKHLSQAQILEEINDLIRDCGLDDSYQLSRRPQPLRQPHGTNGEQNSQRA